MRIEVIHPRELEAGELAHWRALQSASPDLGSPFLTPEWAQLIGQHRADARVAVLFEHGRPRGYFGVQRPSRFAAMGIGAPISDYQGVVATPDTVVTAAELCTALRVGRIDLTHVPESQAFFAPHARGNAGSWLADLSGGPEAYRAAIKERRNEFVRQTDKKWRKLEREKGALSFAPMSQNRAHFLQMLGWKRAQLRRTGQPSIWETPWVAAVVEKTFAATDPNLHGVLCALETEGHLVAASYFLRSGPVLHDWIIAHNPAFESYSPGVLLARSALEWGAANGVAEVDFGPGEYQYKRQLATGQRQLSWGSATGVSASGLVRTAQYAARARIERVKNPRVAALPGKAMRRVDLMRALGSAR